MIHSGLRRNVWVWVRVWAHPLCNWWEVALNCHCWEQFVKSLLCLEKIWGIYTQSRSPLFCGSGLSWLIALLLLFGFDGFDKYKWEIWKNTAGKSGRSPKASCCFCFSCSPTQHNKDCQHLQLLWCHRNEWSLGLFTVFVWYLPFYVECNMMT